MPAFAAVTLMIDGHAPIPMMQNHGHRGMGRGSRFDPRLQQSLTTTGLTLAQPYQDRFLTSKPITGVSDARSAEPTDG